MVRWLWIVLGTLRSAVRTHRDLAVENLALRQQLAVWKARQPRPRLTEMDRLFWVLLSRRWTSWRRSLHLVRPKTVVGWHRQGFRRYWAWKSRGRSGRPMISQERRELIRRMSRANPLWGAPRIHGELLKLGVTVSQATVSKYMVRRRRSPSQAWRTFLNNHAKDLIALDFFTVPTATCWTASTGSSIFALHTEVIRKGKAGASGSDLDTRQGRCHPAWGSDTAT
jgi:putative transposase